MSQKNHVGLTHPIKVNQKFRGHTTGILASNTHDVDIKYSMAGNIHYYITSKVSLSVLELIVFIPRLPLASHVDEVKIFGPSIIKGIEVVT